MVGAVMSANRAELGWDWTAKKGHGGWRAVVKSIFCSSKGCKFNSQHQQQAVYNCNASPREIRLPWFWGPPFM